MSALAEKIPYIPPQEYLLNETDRQDGLKHEYINGQVYAMTGASRNHNHIASNLLVQLAIHLRGTGCQVFHADMKVHIQTLREEYFYYPDIQVTCADEDETYYNQSPCLIIEVLSKSTARIDRTEKWSAYQLLPSLQEYVLCSQDAPMIEIYRKSNAWRMENYCSGQSTRLESVRMPLVVDDLYDFAR